jgi:hypothetical protein
VAFPRSKIFKIEQLLPKASNIFEKEAEMSNTASFFKTSRRHT